ncbi:hypothetical protein IEQ34_013458 [Dendrobium chrysotoxum]|uniref:Uncharacterized protein n=1 Tax=Dendrobium chrysotoxum TaxID=161865 RepID=A0AAV7GR29_DENCH|nr:hypothetical protein IEQ34_013458 [Dendrobium chrysotoxum]
MQTKARMNMRAVLRPRVEVGRESWTVQSLGGFGSRTGLRWLELGSAAVRDLEMEIEEEHEWALVLNGLVERLDGPFSGIDDVLNATGSTNALQQMWRASGTHHVCCEAVTIVCSSSFMHLALYMISDTFSFFSSHKNMLHWERSDDLPLDEPSEAASGMPLTDRILRMMLMFETSSSSTKTCYGGMIFFHGFFICFSYFRSVLQIQWSLRIQVHGTSAPLLGVRPAGSARWVPAPGPAGVEPDRSLLDRSSRPLLGRLTPNRVLLPRSAVVHVTFWCLQQIHSSEWDNRDYSVTVSCSCSLWSDHRILQLDRSRAQLMGTLRQIHPTGPQAHPSEGFEEIEYEEELDACEKEGVKADDGKANANVPKLEHHHLSESILPVTPFPSCRSSVKLPFLSSGKPPRSSTLSLMNRSENQQAECKSDQIFHDDDDTSEDLRVNSSPCTAVKTASPNGKRVSLPLNGFGMSPNLKGGRKLILKSIPSFPSLSTDAPSSTQINSSVLS